MKRKLFVRLALLALVLPFVLASPVSPSLTKEQPLAAVPSPVSVPGQEAQPPARKQSLTGQAVAQGGKIVTAGNAFYRVHVQKSARRGVGLFTVTTGPAHPSGPGLNLLHGDGTPGTSFTTVRSYNTGTDYIQGMGYKNSGYSCIYLDKFGIVTPLGTTGFRTTYTLPGPPRTPDALTIIQDVNVQGSTHHNSKVVVTTSVSNRGTDIVQVGIRYLWDFQSVSDDGPTFQQIVLPLPEKRAVETEYRAPEFKQFAMTDNDGDPKPQDFTVVGSARGSTASARPDVLKYACWPHVFDTAFDYDLWHCDIATKAAAHQTGVRGGDSAVAYYFGGNAGSALTIAPSVRQTVSATLFAFSPTQVGSCPVCNGVGIVEAQVKRNNEEDTVFSSDPLQFCKDDKINGRLRTKPDNATNTQIKWELRLLGASSSTVKAHGSGTSFTDQSLDVKGTWRCIFYCDTNGNGMFDGSELNVQTNTFSVNEVIVHELTVVKHPSIGDDEFIEGLAIALLADATSRLRRRDLKDDVRCCIKLQLSGSLGVFDRTAPSNINNDPELESVWQVTGNIKIVSAINRCEGRDDTFLGCTKIGEQNMIIQKDTMGSVWAHEFGHAKGLGLGEHGTGPAHRIMRSGVNPTNLRTVSREQCDKYEGK